MSRDSIKMHKAGTSGYDMWLLTVAGLFVLLDLCLWWQIFKGAGTSGDKAVFLDVGQGDSELIEMASGPRILFDAGPVRKLTPALDRVIGRGRKYLDAVLITHPESDHAGGLLDALDYYQVGVFICSGAEPSETGKDLWQAILNKLKDKKVPIITLGRGDGMSYANRKISIISPDDKWIYSAAPNDAGLVAKVELAGFSVLLTADIDVEVEKYLMKSDNLRVDALKLPHHGSKTGLSEDFYRAVNPGVVLIEVGAGNKYGHPDAGVLDSVSSTLPNSKIYRTDKNGDIVLGAYADVLTVTMARR